MDFRPKKEIKKEYEDTVVNIRRITKVVKGGRRFRFSALVVIGNRKGRIGFGTGKANEVPDAIKKAIADAHKNIISIPMVKTTIPHEAVGKHGAGKVLVLPASEGTGIIAGGAVRSVLELSGISDILSKCLGSRNPINMVRSTFKALSSLRTLRSVAKARGFRINEVR